MAKRYNERMIEKIAERAGLNKDVVKMVMEALVDVAIVEITNKGHFKLMNLLTIKTAKFRTSGVSSSYRASHHRLVVSLSERVRTMFKIGDEAAALGAQANITVDNWRTVLQNYEEIRRGRKPKPDSDKMPEI